MPGDSPLVGAQRPSGWTNVPNLRSETWRKASPKRMKARVWAPGPSSRGAGDELGLVAGDAI